MFYNIVIGKLFSKGETNMKKMLAIFLSLTMVLSLAVGFAVNSSAANLEWVEETYCYQDALEEVGTHGDGAIEIDEATGAYNSADGFFFCDGLWTYEYWDPELESFELMSAYYKEKQDGWVHGGWSNIYTAFAESAWTSSGYSYCSIMSNGKYLHPGDTAGAVLTFVVPVSGTISYEAGIYAYGDGNTDEKKPETWGDYVTLWVNDTQVYPAPADDPEISRIGYQNSSSAEPLKVSYPSFKANAGDKIRLCVIAAGGDNGGKGTCLSQMPTITYHEAGIPIGNPNGVPPTNIMTERSNDDNSTDTVVTWDAAKNAVGYNIYLGGEKVNDAPITETTYTLTGLEASTLYELTISSVTAAGSESAQSDVQTFKTKKVKDAPASDKTSDDASTNAGTDVPSTDAPAKDPAPKAGFPIWIVIVAGVAVVAIVAVLVIVLGKKKKPADAAPAAEAEAAPAEENKDAE